MNRLVSIAAFIFFGCSLLLQAQKSKVISVFQLIETEKYEEAKEAIEIAVNDENTSDWYRTWYAKGLLCQTAYQKGKEAKNKKKYQLYDDQLYVTFSSFDKALSLDKRGRIDENLAPMYVILANDFQELGEKHYNSGEYEDALKAFEHALKINQSPILSVQIDTNLKYNTALAAYQSEEWGKAIKYLGSLHEACYSPNASHLLFKAYLEKGDTVSAEKILFESIDHFEENEDLVLFLVNLLLNTNEVGRSLELLDRVSSETPSNYVYPYTKGMVYQKIEQYEKSIEAYEKAIILAPGETKIYVNLGTCYYNIGVEIDENARSINNNRIFLEQKARSAEAFKSALPWFEKANNMDPENEKVITKLYELYRILDIPEKMKSMEKQIN